MEQIYRIGRCELRIWWFCDGTETLRILKIFGMQGSYIEQLIFQNDAVRFQVEGERVLVGTVDTAFLFFPSDQIGTCRQFFSL